MMDRTAQNLASVMGFGAVKPHGCLVDRIVSDAQSGAARGALDAAIALGISHGGACAVDRIADDGPLDERYVVHPLRTREDSKQTIARGTNNFGERVGHNIEHSNGTLLVTFCSESQMDGRTKHTRNLTKLKRKAMVHLQMPNSALDVSAKTVIAVRNWLKRCAIRTLHVTGPLESKEPGIARVTKEFLELVLREEQPEASAE